MKASAEVLHLGLSGTAHPALLLDSNAPAAIVANVQHGEGASTTWKLCSCPGHVCTAPIPRPVGLLTGGLHLSFLVSLDEEHVQVLAASETAEFDLGDRSHNYLLLTLARQRIEDKAHGFPEAACGWLDVHDLEHDATLGPPRLNIHVYRARRQFEALGVVDPRRIVERRLRTRHLRIGTGYLSVVQV